VIRVEVAFGGMADLPHQTGKERVVEAIEVNLIITFDDCPQNNADEI
jgi:hypothetical protein